MIFGVDQLDVFFEKSVVNRIEDEVELFNSCETGGILLGYYGCSCIKVCESIGSGERGVHSEASFEYDAAYIEKRANDIAKKYCPQLELVGIWHSHINGDVHLSKDDIELTMKYATDSKNGIIHLLVTKKASEKIYNIFYASNLGQIENVGGVYNE